MKEVTMNPKQLGNNLTASSSNKEKEGLLLLLNRFDYVSPTVALYLTQE